MQSNRARNGPPGPTKFSFGPGGPIGKNCWAGRAKFFVGPARPGVLFKFNALYICHKQSKLLKKFTKEKIFEFYIEIFKKNIIISQSNCMSRPYTVFCSILITLITMRIWLTEEMCRKQTVLDNCRYKWQFIQPVNFD